MAHLSNLSLRAHQVSKRYNHEWIFKNLSFEFISGNIYTVTGSNGSGKSTLLQILLGHLPCTTGSIEYFKNSIQIPNEEVYNHVSIAAPYLELIEEYTLQELLTFHFSLRKIKLGFKLDDLTHYLKLDHAEHKTIASFSSGMKQRLKLGLAFYTQADFVFLDEPFTNLDMAGIEWYHHQFQHLQDAIVIIASNDIREYTNANQHLDLNSLKK